MPTLFLSHGAGPAAYVRPSTPPSRFSEIDCASPVTAWYKQIATQIGLTGDRKPKAIVIVSAHWETNEVVRVSGREENKELNYDYGGFPSYTYELKYPAPGNPTLAQRIVASLNAASIPATLDTTHNFDHGVFVPLGLIYPEADIPIVQLSMLSSLSPSQHLSIGKTLSSLRSEGILIVGSGSATHGSFKSHREAEEFISELNKVLKSASVEERERGLKEWTKLKYARNAHPREEHLLPLHVVVGAAGDYNQVKQLTDKWALGELSLHSFLFESNN